VGRGQKPRQKGRRWEVGKERVGSGRKYTTNDIKGYRKWEVWMPQFPLTLVSHSQLPCGKTKLLGYTPRYPH